MPPPSLESTRKAILEGNRRAVAKAITQLESTRPDFRDYSKDLLESLLPQTGHSIRIAITGVPGVGKSTFIESFGLSLIEHGHKVAVLAVDPSSPVSGGSILGDKTRMQELSRHPQAFIRPSPTSGIMGGVAGRTREALLLCEAAGYDIILVETVGVGQSEIQAASMVDLFALLLLPNAGDELQGIKKGILEMADLVLVNKTDGHLKEDAERTFQEIGSALRIFAGTDDLHIPVVLTCSALLREGMEEIRESLIRRKEHLEKIGAWELKRREQMKKWLETLLREELYNRFLNQPGMRDKIAGIETEVVSGRLLPTGYATDLVEEWLSDRN